MSWVLLALRKSELKMQQSQYVARELQISRAQRRDARQYQLEQMYVRNALRNEKNELYANYKTTRDGINAQIKMLRQQSGSSYSSRQDNPSYSINQYINSLDKKLSGIDNSEANKDAREELQSKINIADSIKNGTNSTNDINGQITDLQAELTSAKEDYEVLSSNAQNDAEEELERIENEANDVDTMHEEEKVQNETQLEAIKQELQTVSDAISEYIQSETIKI